MARGRFIIKYSIFTYSLGIYNNKWQRPESKYLRLEFIEFGWIVQYIESLRSFHPPGSRRPTGNSKYLESLLRESSFERDEGQLRDRRRKEQTNIGEAGGEKAPGATL